MRTCNWIVQWVYVENAILILFNRILKVLSNNHTIILYIDYINFNNILLEGKRV